MFGMIIVLNVDRPKCRTSVEQRTSSKTFQLF